MKYSIILNIIFLLLSLVNAGYIKKEDDNYLIYVNNTYGVVSDNIKQKRQESQQYITSVMEEIQNIIIENKDTYKNPEELKVFEKRQTNLRKRNNNSKVSYVNEISSVDDITVLSAYLSNEVKEKVNSIPSILGSEPRRKISLIPSNEKVIKVDDNKEKREFLEDKSIDDVINEIKLETGWKDVEYNKEAPLQLSLLSQGYFNGTTNQYDTNYYYPKTAGQDIDVYVIDTAFDFRTPEYANKEERVTKCLGYLVNGTLQKPDSEDYCEPMMLPGVNNPAYSMHGKITSMIVGGLTQGAANKANIYGFAVAIDGEDGDFSNEMLLSGLDYLLNNVPMRPHKSIINLSLGDYFSLKDSYYLDFTTRVFNKFNENGVIVVSASGNDGVPVYDIEEDKISLPCALDNVICVGATDEFGYSNSIFDLTGKMHPENYLKADFSNFGEKVDIYGPGFIFFDGESVSDLLSGETFLSGGTSFSSPIVAGVIATIMSEHSDIQFNTQSMISYLTDIGEKDIIEGIPEGPNVFINNGKHSVYFKDVVEDDSTPSIIDDIYDDSNPTEIGNINDDSNPTEIGNINDDSNVIEIEDSDDELSTIEDVTDINEIDIFDSDSDNEDDSNKN